MSKKLSTIQPKGNITFHTYLGDQAGCGHIRVIFPSLMLNQFRYKGMTFESTYNSTFVNEPSFYRNLSFLKFQRSATETHLKIIMRAKEFSYQHNFGLIYETDDLLTKDIPETNHAHSYYKKMWPYIERMLATVNGVVVSTEPLKSQLQKYNNNIQVIHNRLAPWLWHQQDAFKKIENQNGKIRILWAGSQNHFNINGSGGDFSPELIKFVLKTLDVYQWVFVGARPYELQNNNKIEFHEWIPVASFGQYLNNLNCDIGIAPLESNIFNDCKSNIKVQEYCSLGIPGVYSKSYPYKTSKLCSETTEEFISNIEKLAKNPDERYSTWLFDYNINKDCLYWDDISLKEYINKHLKLFNKKLG